MPDRYWSRILAIGLGPLLIGAVALWLYADEQRQQRAETAHHDRDKAYSEAQESCGSISGALDQLYCVLDEAETTEEEKRNEYDLKAQQDMALFALAMAIFTFISLGIGLAGVYYVARSLNLTRQLFLEERRPWLEESLTTEGMQIFHLENSFGFVAKMIFRNVGQMPAVNIHFHRLPYTYDWPADEALLKERIAAIKENSSTPGRAILPGGQATFPIDFQLDDIGTIYQGRTAYVAGFVEYTYAGSSRIHVTPFAWSIGGGLKEMSNRGSFYLSSIERAPLNVPPE